jgi:hypothetical protein
MEAQQIDVSAVDVTVVSDCRAWDATVAQGVSLVVSPPLLVVLSLALTTAAAASARAWQLTGLYALLAAGLPLGFIGWLVATGRAADVDLSIRAERMKPLLVAVGGMAAGWTLLLWSGAPPQLTALALANVIQITLVLLITGWWKISMHSIAVSAFAVVVGALYGPLAMAGAAALIPAVVWARLRLRRHTPGQTLAGVALGGGVMALTLFFAGS